MVSLLAKCIDECCPKFNKDVTEGFAKPILEGAPEFLDQIFRESIASLNKSVDLNYIGYSLPTPEQEFNRLFSGSENRINYDLAKTDIFMMDLNFMLNGRPFVKPLYIPFAERGNLISISNTVYHFIPVLSDTVISPSSKEVFVRLLKDKLSFKSKTRNIVINGERTPVEVIYSNIVRVNDEQVEDKLGKPLPAISLYMLGEMGLKAILSKYFKIKDFFITNEVIPDEIKKEYDIYESTGIRPSNLKGTSYIPHGIKIGVHKKHGRSITLDNFMSGVIYGLDILPNEADNVMEVYKSEYDMNNEVLLWRVILGRIVYKNNHTVTRILTDFQEVFNTLRSYMDNLTKKTLKNIDINVESFFDLCIIILSRYNEWLMSYKEYNSSIKNRYVDMRYYIFYDIIIGFNKFINSLNKRGSKNKHLSDREVIRIGLIELSSKKIYSLTKAKSINLAIQMAEVTSDIMFPKVTAHLED